MKKDAITLQVGVSQDRKKATELLVMGYLFNKHLFIHKDPFDRNKKPRWSISHVHTGMMIKNGIFTRVLAVQLVEQIADLIDWDFSEPTDIFVRDADQRVAKKLYPERNRATQVVAQQTEDQMIGDPADKFEQLAVDYGFNTTFDLLQEYHTDSVVPGICMEEDCDYSTDVEPDQNQGWCEICGKNSVKSAMMLAGLM